MAKSKKDLRRPIIKVDRKRFAAGWRQVTKKIGKNGIIDLIPPKPDVVFDVIRPADLVSFTVAGYGVQLIGGDKPRIVPKRGAKARLVVQFSFQHMAENAIYETPAKVPNEKGLDPEGPPIDDMDIDQADAKHQPPIQAKPSKTSRLVFNLPNNEKVPFSIQGILEAIGRLEMVLHPLAKPHLIIKPPIIKECMSSKGFGQVGHKNKRGFQIPNTFFQFVRQPLMSNYTSCVEASYFS